jgi:BirA family biotin operon repressor/biotin-[acetyl-CoA-carboxylase] ligase
MNLHLLETELQSLGLGGIRFFERIDSTNSEASRWMDEGAPHLALVVADEQTAGRGRLERRWYTPAGSALAFSLLLRPEDLRKEMKNFAKQGGQAPEIPLDEAIFRGTALGALAVYETLQEDYHLPAQIKWPNDVLVGGRKLTGVLAETHWKGDQLLAMILGIGINVAPESLPAQADLNYPATCVEEALWKTTGLPTKVDRVTLLRSALARLISWIPRMASEEFRRAWENSLAFRGEWVVVLQDTASGKESQPPQEGQVLGIAPDGSLRLLSRSGDEFHVQVGEIRLRPLNG